MATYSTNEFRAGLKVMLEGDPCAIIENEFVKPGKGQAFNRVRLRNLKTGRVWEHIPQLFARNERLVCYFETAIGTVAIILVGAMIVGSMETVWSKQVNRSRYLHRAKFSNQTTPIELKKGEELGRFKLGSTVILLLPPHTVELSPTLSAQQPVKMGEHLGMIKTKC